LLFCIGVKLGLLYWGKDTDWCICDEKNTWA